MRPPTGYGHTRRSRLPSSAPPIVDLLRATTRAISEPSPTRPSPITLVLRLLYGRIWDGLSTTTSYRGFPDNGYREFFDPPCFQELHVTNNVVRSCTCPGEDHPGPFSRKGRGAPEIDVFEAERNKTGAPGGIVSQSAQFAPFTHDYLFDNSTPDKYIIYNPDITVPNNYRGSAVYVTTSTVFACFS